jgi:hypothetical protein
LFNGNSNPDLDGHSSTDSNIDLYVDSHSHSDCYGYCDRNTWVRNGVQLHGPGSCDT